jgi:hypothetical protein
MRGHFHDAGVAALGLEKSVQKGCGMQGQGGPPETLERNESAPQPYTKWHDSKRKGRGIGGYCQQYMLAEVVGEVWYSSCSSHARVKRLDVLVHIALRSRALLQHHEYEGESYKSEKHRFALTIALRVG